MKLLILAQKMAHDDDDDDDDLAALTKSDALERNCDTSGCGPRVAFDPLISSHYRRPAKNDQ